MKRTGKKPKTESAAAANSGGTPRASTPDDSSEGSAPDHAELEEDTLTMIASEGSTPDLSELDDGPLAMLGRAITDMMHGREKDNAATAMASNAATTTASNAPTVTVSESQNMLEQLAAHYMPTASESEVPAPLGVDFAKSDSAATLTLTKRDRLTLATITPPQTCVHKVVATPGAHCLVIDVSFSMEASATVTSEDGDKVDHGFSVLDIAKHATCTYIASLDDADYACVASYASNAKLVIGWTACDEAGKKKLCDAIRSLKEEGSTNLTGGLSIGFGMFAEELPAAVAERPEDYAMLLAVATDGQPSSGTHPRGGTSASPGEYAAFVREKAAAVSAMHGPAAAPNVVAIGLGNELDSTLLRSFSSTFLHIPDPGSTGPCLVNLLAATRCTARLQASADGATRTNRAVLHLSPPEAVTSVPGYEQAVRTADAVLVPLGSLIYDQCRHVMVLTESGAPPLTAVVTVEGAAVAACDGATPAAARDLSAFEVEVERTSAFCALSLQERRLAMLAPTDDVAARLAREGARIGDVTISLVWNDEADLDLHVFVPKSPSDDVGEHISYSQKKSKVHECVELDVDMNASASLRSKEPVENVYAGDAARGVKAPVGTYRVEVENYGYHGEGAANRPIPFKVQVRMDGDVCDYTGVVRGAKQKAKVCTFCYTGRSEASEEATKTRQEEARRRTAELDRLRRVPENVLEQATALLRDGPLKKTLTDEALLAVRPEKHKTWGKHYLATLPQMLMLERRSNFRDLALQSFGRDAKGREAFFEELSGAAETCFAMLPPPKPSNIERNARKAAASAASRVQMSRLPDEFMRGGGCFAPDARVACCIRSQPGDAEEDTLVCIDELSAGAVVRTASGGTARVRCVVQSPTDEGVALLSELPTGLKITEWHPVLDHAGHWCFPITLGRAVSCRCPYVYNLVLDREHVALIDGVPCVTLGHGIEGPVVGHAFYGTDAVLEVLAAQPGWAEGRIVLDGPLRAPTMPAAEALRA